MWFKFISTRSELALFILPNGPVLLLWGNGMFGNSTYMPDVNRMPGLCCGLLSGNKRWVDRELQ